MLAQFALSSFLAVALSLTMTGASPIDSLQDLVTRDNKYNLMCGNAPNVKAGDMVNPSDAQLGTGLSNSGSSDPWFKYLYCTVGTKTYAFYGLGDMTPAAGQPQPGYRNVYSAFTQAAATVQAALNQKGDGDIGGGWKFIQQDTQIVLEVQDSVGHITYGILHAFLTGMADAALNYDPTNAPMVFQINDGQWGEVGIGYAGYLDPQTGQCYYEITPQGNSSCQDVLDKKVIN